MSLNTIVNGLFAIDTKIGQLTGLNAQLPVVAQDVMTAAAALGPADKSKLLTELRALQGRAALNTEGVVDDITWYLSGRDGASLELTVQITGAGGGRRQQLAYTALVEAMAAEGFTQFLEGGFEGFAGSFSVVVPLADATGVVTALGTFLNDRELTQRLRFQLREVLNHAVNQKHPTETFRKFYLIVERLEAGGGSGGGGA